MSCCLAGGVQPRIQPGPHGGIQPVSVRGFQHAAMAASSGGMNRRVSGSRRTPRAARTCGGASATHSPTAVNDAAPASTAATAPIDNHVRLCRTPRRLRGSGTHARYSARPGHWPDSSARSLAGRPQARVLAEDRGIRCVTLDYDAMRGADDGALGLF